MFSSAALRSRISRNEGLREAELALSAALARSDASPFLGQHALPRRAADIIRGNFLGEPPVETLSAFFDLFPATTVAYIAGLARVETGRSGEGEFYPHLERELDARLSGAERTRLHDNFRRACLRLGLPVLPDAEYNAAGSWRRVLQYLLQAGPGQMSMPALAAACLETERELGGFDYHDTGAAQFWQSHLIERLEARGRHTLARVLAEDGQAWHARCIMRLRSGAVPELPFEQSLREALDAAPPAREGGDGRIGPATQVVYRDGEVLLATPMLAGDWVWEVQGGWTGGPVTLRPGEELPVSDERALTVQARRTAIDADDPPPPRPVSVWAEHRVLLFEGRAGRRVQSPAPAGPVHFVSRQPFQAGAAASSAQSSGLHVLTAAMADGQTIHARFADGVEAVVTARAEPLLDWHAGAVAELEGAPVVTGAGLELAVSLPTRFAEVWAAGVDLLLRTPYRELARLPIALDADGEALLRPEFETGSRFDRLTAAVVRRGESRPLVQAAAAWLWPGLEAVEDGVYVGQPPTNFDEPCSPGVARGARGLAAEVGERRGATLAFSRPGAGPYRFRLRRPGTYLELEDGSSRRELPIGATLIDDGAPRFLHIGCDDSEATLLFGGQALPRAFAGAGVRRVQLHSAVGANGEGRVELHQRGDRGLPLTLAVVTQPCSPINPVVERRGGRTWFSFGLREPVSSFELVGVELFSGDSCTLWTRDGVIAEWRNDRWSLAADARRVPDGLWLFEVRGLTTGQAQPRPLRAPRGDSYGLLLSAANGYVTGSADRLAHPPAGWDPSATFERANRIMASCWAKACWADGVEAIDWLWQNSGALLRERARSGDQSAATLLLSSAGIAPPAGSSASWIPMRHPLELNPALWGAEPGLLISSLAEAEDEGARNLSALLASSADGADERKSRHDDACRRFTGRVRAATAAGGNDARLSEAAWLCAQADLEANRRGVRAWPDAPEDEVAAAALAQTAPAFFAGLAFASRLGVVEAWLASLPGAGDVVADLRRAGLLCRLGPELLAWHLDDVRRNVR